MAAALGRILLIENLIGCFPVETVELRRRVVFLDVLHRRRDKFRVRWQRTAAALASEIPRMLFLRLAALRTAILRLVARVSRAPDRIETLRPAREPRFYRLRTRPLRQG